MVSTIGELEADLSSFVHVTECYPHPEDSAMHALILKIRLDKTPTLIVRQRRALIVERSLLGTLASTLAFKQTIPDTHTKWHENVRHLVLTKSVRSNFGLALIH